MWQCDGCHAPGESAKERHRCTEGCDFDYCEKCLEDSKKEIGDAIKTPVFAILDIKNKAYYRPLESFEEVNQTNLLKTMEDSKAGKLTKMTLASNA